MFLGSNLQYLTSYLLNVYSMKTRLAINNCCQMLREVFGMFSEYTFFWTKGQQLKSRISIQYLDADQYPGRISGTVFLTSSADWDANQGPNKTITIRALAHILNIKVCYQTPY